MNDSITAERAAVRYIAAVALGVLAVMLAWFAYIDAPITDAVMLLVALAVAVGVVAALAALWSYSSMLDAPAGEGGAAPLPARARRLRWLAILALSATLLIAAVAMVATLNVRGEDSGGGASSSDDTSGSV